MVSESRAKTGLWLTIFTSSDHSSATSVQLPHCEAWLIRQVPLNGQNRLSCAGLCLAHSIATWKSAQGRIETLDLQEAMLLFGPAWLFILHLSAFSEIRTSRMAIEKMMACLGGSDVLLGPNLYWQ